MGIRLNPFTGELDLVGSTGSGSGTVTSVAGGVGITNTPEPIVGAGIVDLDLFTLTTEPAIAAGDWIPFVDVSVGTAPTAQRKLTLSDLLVGLETLGIDATTLDGFDSSAFLLLAGRAGAANNPLISTDGPGIITGSGAHGVLGLALLAVNDTELHALDIISVNATAQTFIGSGATAADLVIYGASFIQSALTLDTTTDELVSMFLLAGGGTWDVVGTNGFRSLSLLNFEPEIRSEVGVDQRLLGFGAIINFGPTFHARGGDCTAGDVSDGIAVFNNVVKLSASAGGTMSLSRLVTVQSEVQATAGCSIGTFYGLIHQGANPLIDSIGEDTALNIQDGAKVPVGVFASVRSQQAERLLRHVGAGVFGADAAASGSSVGLEVQSTTRALLVSRMTTAQKTALTPLDGMTVYDSTLGLWQFRQAGAWLAFQPLDAGLTALSSLGAGIAVSDGADGWTPRSIAVTDTATIDLTVTNANGVAGNPTLSADVIPGGITHSALGGLTTGDAGHTQFFLLTGRAGGQVGIGGTGAGDDFTAQSTSNATKGDLIWDDAQQWWPSIPDFGASTTTTKTVARFDATLVMSPTSGAAIHTLRMLRFEPSITSEPGATEASNITVLDIAPAAITIGRNVGITVLGTSGSIINSVAPTLGTAFLFSNGFKFESQTANVSPYTPNSFIDQAILSYNVSSGSATAGTTRAFYDNRTVQNVLAGGTFTNTNFTSFQSSPSFVETAGTLNVTTRRGYLHSAIAVGGTSPAITTDVAIDIEDTKISAVSTALSLRSAGASVEMRHRGPAMFGLNAAPNADLYVDIDGGLAMRRVDGGALGAGNNNNFALGNRSFLKVTANAAGSTITGIANGVDGKLLIIYNTANNLTIAHEDGNSTAANRIRTPTAAGVATVGEGSFMMIYDSGQSRWILIETIA